MQSSHHPLLQFSGLLGLVTAALLGSRESAPAQLPADFPAVTTQTYNSNAVATGYVFIASTPVTNSLPGLASYLLILKNDGSPHGYKKVWRQSPGDFPGIDFKVLPNGLLHYSQLVAYHSYTDGGAVEHVLLDEDLNEIAPRLQMGNGYAADSHDFELLPNGHVLLVGYYTTLADLRQVVPGAHPRAEISGAVIQELDANQNVVWQWRTWDHFELADYPCWDAGAAAPVCAGWPVNVARLDPKDSQLLVATPEEVMKINRQTGDVLWRLGGASNQFTFVGVSQAEGKIQFGGHDFQRLPNGNVLIYNGGTADAVRTSRIHEYQLDEQSKIATHVWSYTPTEMIPNATGGSSQRLPNGNSFIGWGPCLDTNLNPPDCTEVTAAGNKVWEMWFDHRVLHSYRAFRSVYPPSAQRIQMQHLELAAGNTYNFANTGITLNVIDRTGDGYNSVTVAREPYAPLFPIFQGKAPRLLPVRVNLSQTAIDSISAEISFDVTSFGVADPANVTVYFRNAPGEVFVPLPTSYNWVTHQIVALMDGFGDFALGFPDLPDVAYPPLLIEPESLQSTGFVTRVPPLVQAAKSYSANQQLPVALTWTPKGFATGYALQISTNAGFATPEVDNPFLLEARYTFAGAKPGTTYYWRVSTWNDAGLSSWATNAFTTVPPQLQVTAPNGGEAWQRGLKYFIQWNDNFLEDVVIELYRGGTLVQTIASNAPSTVSHQWTVDLSLPPASDYAIRIRSATNASVFDAGDAAFSIVDAPAINAGSGHRLPDGRVQFSLTAPGATQATVRASTNLVDWQDLQSVPVTNGSAVFTDHSATNYTRRYYGLRLPF